MVSLPFTNHIERSPPHTETAFRRQELGKRIIKLYELRAKNEKKKSERQDIQVKQARNDKQSCKTENRCKR